MDKKVLSRKEAVQILVQYQLNKLSKQERMWILENWWETDEDDPEFFQLPSDLQTEIKEYDSPAEPLLIKYDRLLLIALTDSLSGVKNTYLKNQLAQLSIEIAEKVLKEELAQKEKQQKIINEWIDDINFN